ncbi:hypothetical protein F5051DRAFT_131858 [Lentinula edodes]|nr:hypothetical protein F5051DRAFT_131858 [Lentinula edodes]
MMRKILANLDLQTLWCELNISTLVNNVQAFNPNYKMPTLFPWFVSLARFLSAHLFATSMMPDYFCLLAALILIFSVLSPFNGVDAAPISRVSSSDLSHVPNGLMKPRYILPTSTNRSSDCEVRVETVSTPYVVVVKGSADLVGFVRLMYNDLRDIPVAISIQINVGPSVLVSFFVVLLLVAGLGFVSGPEDENDHECEDHDCYACNHYDLEEKVGVDLFP